MFHLLLSNTLCLKFSSLGVIRKNPLAILCPAFGLDFRRIHFHREMCASVCTLTETDDLTLTEIDALTLTEIGALTLT